MSIKIRKFNLYHNQNLQPNIQLHALIYHWLQYFSDILQRQNLNSMIKKQDITAAAKKITAKPHSRQSFL